MACLNVGNSALNLRWYTCRRGNKASKREFPETLPVTDDDDCNEVQFTAPLLPHAGLCFEDDGTKRKREKVRSDKVTVTMRWCSDR
mmetsp:Transcript_5177/g.7275  ORF Transcript_5177/g.7275 Transcript_5177/m.7275 type:complete len:86 (-) Transcript_5177:104-361(-)